MPCNGILVRIDQVLQPLPAALGAIEVDDLEPVRPRVNERLPTLGIERDALDVAAAPVASENLNPDVLVMQPANQSVRHDASDLLNG
jgi:hypothetical protein